MTEVEHGAVAYEMRNVQADHRWLTEHAERASRLLDAKSKHTPEALSRRWRNLDSTQQEELSEELLYVPTIGSITDGVVESAALSPRSARAVRSTVEAYHDTLPFTRTERLWLNDARFRAIEHFEAEDASVSAIQWVMGQRDELIVLGRSQSVVGDELIDREWDWVRGAGEFKGSSAYEESRAVLRGFVRLFDIKG